MREWNGGIDAANVAEAAKARTKPIRCSRRDEESLGGSVRVIPEEYQQVTETLMEKYPEAPKLTLLKDTK
jgi:hypothetical protein